MREIVASPTDDTIVAVLNFMHLSRRHDRVLVIALAAGDGIVDPLLSARSTTNLLDRA